MPLLYCDIREVRGVYLPPVCGITFRLVFDLFLGVGGGEALSRAACRGLTLNWSTWQLGAVPSLPGLLVSGSDALVIYGAHVLMSRG